MFRTFLKILLGMIAGKLKDFVLEVVSGLEKETITNKEKRDAAFQQIKHRATVAGRDIRDSAINLAIELAVSLLKKN